MVVEMTNSSKNLSGSGEQKQSGSLENIVNIYNPKKTRIDQNSFWSWWEWDSEKMSYVEKLDDRNYTKKKKKNPM